MTKHTEKFKENWKRFETNLYGKLLATMEKQELTVGLANIILRDILADWLSMYDICGRWLNEYSAENPEKGREIKEILERNVRFTTEIKQNKTATYMKYALPVVGAAIGSGVASALSKKLAIRAAATVLPAAALYPVASQYEKNNGGKHKVIEGYIAQLDTYRADIVNIIEN